MTTRDIVSIALFAALTAALGLFPPIPLPVTGVPITAQSMGPMLAGCLLGARRGGLSMLLVIVLVAVGLPILSGGRGGLGVFAGPTAGFLLSWPLVAVLIGALCERVAHGVFAAMAWNVLAGIGLSYLMGIGWLCVVTGLPVLKATLGSALFVPGDLAKAILAALVADAVRRSYPMAAPVGAG